MVDGVTIDVTPLSFCESTDQEQKRGLRLVEFGYQITDDMELIARSDDNLRGGVQNKEPVSVHP